MVTGAVAAKTPETKVASSEERVVLTVEPVEEVPVSVTFGMMSFSSADLELLAICTQLVRLNLRILVRRAEILVDLSHKRIGLRHSRCCCPFIA